VTQEPSSSALVMPPEFAPLLRAPSRRGLSSRRLPWSDVVMEHYSCPEGERPETVSDRHILALWTTSCICLRSNGGGSYTRFRKLPGICTYVPPGLVPRVIPETGGGFLCCSFDPAFMRRIEGSLEGATGEACYKTGFEDAGLRQIMLLLRAEIEQGGPTGKLYADSLVYAMAVRLLCSERKVNHTVGLESPMPTAALRRVVERMHTLSPTLDLQTLANESGYSRRHFLRMFERATGRTPYRYLLNLRVERARVLLKEGRASMVDIALECGFSNQAHLCTVFRKETGVTPGAYRRSMQGRSSRKSLPQP
jgi:AraC family transcriptional regulator